MRLLNVMAMLMLVTPAMAEDKPKNELICGPNAQMEKVLNEKGYRHLMDMKSENGVVESFWIGGQMMVATAQRDEKISCLLTQFSEVTLNPKTIETIYTVLKSTQKEL